MTSSPPPPPALTAGSAVAGRRVALTRPFVGDHVQFDGTTGIITHTHGDRFVTVQPSDGRAPARRVLLRDLRISSPSGGACAARETRRTLQLLACDDGCEVDARGVWRRGRGGGRGDESAPLCARMNQYHLLQIGCSDCVGALARLERLEVQAQGMDQVRVRVHLQRLRLSKHVCPAS